MFVHSLVRTERNTAGWEAPWELGEDTPQYVSFALPTGFSGRLVDEYWCEVVVGFGQNATIRALPFVRRGDNEYELLLPNADPIRFVLPRQDREAFLPYVGTIPHEDFTRSLVEVEPDDIARLDDLFERTGLTVIGCDPERYAAAGRLSRRA